MDLAFFRIDNFCEVCTQMCARALSCVRATGGGAGARGGMEKVVDGSGPECRLFGRSTHLKQRRSSRDNFTLIGNIFEPFNCYVGYRLKYNRSRRKSVSGLEIHRLVRM